MKPHLSRLLSGLRALAACGLGMLLAFGAVALAAEPIRVQPGEIVDFETREPRRVAVRLANTGDSSLGIVARDSARQVSINARLGPGEVRDFLTPSAEIATATVNARGEGTLGGVLEVLPLTIGDEVRVPSAGNGFPCDPTARVIYSSGDGIGSPEVTYRIRNERGSDCVLQVTLLRAGRPGPEVQSIEAGEFEDFTGVLREISVHGRGDDSDTFVFFYTRLR